HRGEEVLEVVVLIAISLWRNELLITSRYRSFRMLPRILLRVLRLDLRLHGLGKGVNGEPRLLLARHTIHRHPGPADLHRAFIAGEDEALALFAAVHEVHVKAQVESFAVIEESKHHIVGIAPVFPISDRARAHAADRPVRAGNKMRPA